MNGEAARASKREIRRAFGPQAMQTVVDHEDAISYLASKAQMAEDLLLEHDGNIKALSEQIRDLQQFTDRPFLGRLRWLLTGK